MKTLKKYAICIDNTGYEVSLERKKLYEFVLDESLPDENLIKIIDESGESYLYSAKLFIPLDIPVTVQKILETA